MIESTRDQLLHLLQARGHTPVAALAESLGVGQASVRRHLDHLRADGLADVTVERHGVGRPAFVYFATAQAEERTPGGYSRLLSRLYKGLRSLDESQVRGRDGAQVLQSAFRGAAEQVALEHEAEVPGETLEARVAQTSAALRREGIVDSWTKDGDTFRVTNSACPYRETALATHGPCELDRRVIELLVSAPVRQVSRIVDGHSVCEYAIAAGQNKPAERSE